MELRKIINTEHRPLDYLKERNCRSSVQTRKSYGTNLIGWEATRLKDNLPIKGNYTKTIKFIDNMTNSKFVKLPGKFTKLMDKQLFMKRGFPLHKLDMRKQKYLITEIDNLNMKQEKSSMTHKNASLRSVKKANKNKMSPSSSQQIHGNSNHFSSLQETSSINKRLLKQIKASTRQLYNRIYEDKLKSHFSVPYPKFPYNLDKDTIFLEEQKLGISEHYSRQRKASAHTKIGKTTTTIIQNDHEFYRTSGTAKFFKIKAEFGGHRAKSSKRKASCMLCNHLNKECSCAKPVLNTATSLRDDNKSTNFHSRSAMSRIKDTSEPASVANMNFKEIAKSNGRPKSRATSRINKKNKLDVQMKRVYNNEIALGKP